MLARETIEKENGKMAVTPSTMLALGTKAPFFDLPDPDGKTHSLNDFDDSPALLVIFMCNHCPFVVHMKSYLPKLIKEYQDKGVAVVGINSNDVTSYPEDHPDRMAEEITRYGYTFPYLYDETQEVARAYRAACTPDFFLFDGERNLMYRGQLDASRPGNDKPLTGSDLRAALDAVLEGKPVSQDQKPSTGCNIKWKPGNQPGY